MSEPAKPQKNQGDVTIRLGMVNIPVEVVSTRRSGSKSGFSLVCPEDSFGLGQSLYCKGPEHHGPYDRDDERIRRGRVIEDQMVVVTEAEYDEATAADLPKKEFTIAYVAPREQVMAVCRPDESAYRCRIPTDKKGNALGAKAYGLLRAVITAHPELAFVGELNLRSQKPYLLEVWNDQLVLQSLSYPDDLAPVDEIAPDVVGELGERELAGAEALVSALVTDFTPELLANTKRARVEALMAAKSGTEPAAPAPAPVPNAPTVDPLMAALEASLAVLPPKAKAKAKKEPATKAAAGRAAAKKAARPAA